MKSICPSPAGAQRERECNSSGQLDSQRVLYHLHRTARRSSSAPRPRSRGSLTATRCLRAGAADDAVSEQEQSQSSENAASGRSPSSTAVMVPSAFLSKMPKASLSSATSSSLSFFVSLLSDVLGKAIDEFTIMSRTRQAVHCPPKDTGKFRSNSAASAAFRFDCATDSSLLSITRSLDSVHLQSTQRHHCFLRGDLEPSLPGGPSSLSSLGKCIHPDMCRFR